MISLVTDDTWPIVLAVVAALVGVASLAVCVREVWRAGRLAPALETPTAPFDDTRPEGND